MNVLIVGHGSAGRRHATVLREIHSSGAIEFVTRHPAEGYTCYPELAAVPVLDRYDYFVIASETYRHARDLAFLQKEVTGKTILVEKPLFGKSEPSAPGRNRVLVGYDLRFHPVAQAMKRMLAGRKILSWNAIVGQYLPFWRPGRDYRRAYSADLSRGGGVLLDLSHEIDLLQWMAGPVARLSAFDAKVSDLEIQSDDLALIIGRTDRGGMFTLQLDYLSKRYVRRAVVHTDTFTITADFDANHIRTDDAEGKSAEETFPGYQRNDCCRSMHEAVWATTPGDVCTMEEGLDVLRTVERVRAAHEKGEWQ